MITESATEFPLSISLPRYAELHRATNYASGYARVGSRHDWVWAVPSRRVVAPQSSQSTLSTAVRPSRVTMLPTTHSVPVGNALHARHPLCRRSLRISGLAAGHCFLVGCSHVSWASCQTRAIMPISPDFVLFSLLRPCSLTLLPVLRPDAAMIKPYLVLGDNGDYVTG